MASRPPPSADTPSAGAWPCRVVVPPSATGPSPLLLMLHGCRQGPRDFAAAARLDTLAASHGVIVAWPGQVMARNRARCWNWFEPAHQAQGRGEPALLASVVDHVAHQVPVDRARVFVAGFSAGAAMAVLLAQACPGVFAGVAAHAGLPAGAAFGPASALAVMKSGRRGAGGWGVRKPAPVRTITFHGTADRVVACANSRVIVQDAVAAFTRHGGPMAVHEETVESPGRLPAHVTRHARDGQVLVEQWEIHDGRHGWSGGPANVRFTEPRGPDVSAEMLRFLLAPQRDEAPPRTG